MDRVFDASQLSDAVPTGTKRVFNESDLTDTASTILHESAHIPITNPTVPEPEQPGFMENAASTIDSFTQIKPKAKATPEMSMPVENPTPFGGPTMSLGMSPDMNVEPPAQVGQPVFDRPPEDMVPMQSGMQQNFMPVTDVQTSDMAAPPLPNTKFQEPGIAQEIATGAENLYKQAPGVAARLTTTIAGIPQQIASTAGRVAAQALPEPLSTPVAEVSKEVYEFPGTVGSAAKQTLDEAMGVAPQQENYISNIDYMRKSLLNRYATRPEEYGPDAPIRMAKFMNVLERDYEENGPVKFAADWLKLGWDGLAKAGNLITADPQAWKDFQEDPAETIELLGMGYGGIKGALSTPKAMKDILDPLRSKPVDKSIGEEARRLKRESVNMNKPTPPTPRTPQQLLLEAPKLRTPEVITAFPPDQIRPVGKPAPEPLQLPAPETVYGEDFQMRENKPTPQELINLENEKAVIDNTTPISADEMAKTMGVKPEPKTDIPSSSLGMFGGRTVSDALGGNVNLGIDKLFKRYEKPMQERDIRGKTVDTIIDQNGIRDTPRNHPTMDLFGAGWIQKNIFGNDLTVERAFKGVVDKPNNSEAEKLLDEMFGRSRTKESKLLKQSEDLKTGGYDSFVKQVWDRAWPITKYFSGKDTPIENKTRNSIERRQYASSQFEGYMNRVAVPMLEQMLADGITPDKMNKYLTSNRIVNERGSIDNPVEVRKIQAWLDEEKANGNLPKLEALKDKLNAIWQRDVVEPYLASDLHDPADVEVAKKMRTNADYVPFLVSDKLEGDYGGREYVPSAGIYFQTGTSKDIRDAFAAKIAKGASMDTAVKENGTKIDIVNYFRQEYPGMFKESKVKFIPELENRDAAKRAILNDPAKTDAQKVIEVRDLMKQPAKVKGGFYDVQAPPDTSGMEPVQFKEGGKLKEMYFPADIARAINDPYGKGVHFAGLNEFNRMFKKLWIDYSPGFIQKNVVRDIANVLIQIPGIRDKARFIKYYGKNLSEAFQSIYGIPGPLAQEALDRAVLVGKDVEYATGEALSKETMFERGAKIIDPEALSGSALTKIIGHKARRLLQALPMVAKATERASKLAVFETLKTSKKGYTPDEVDIMTRHMGSPAFMKGGEATATMNQVTSFANSIIRGAEADVYFFKKDPVGFMAAASVPLSMGLLGATFYAASKNPELKKKLKDLGIPGVDFLSDAMQTINPFHRRNNLNMPIRKNSDGTVDYLSAPLPESVKLMNNVIMSFAEKPSYTRLFEGIGSMLAKNAPSGSPALALSDWARQAGNKTPPQDWQTGIPIMPEDVWRDKGVPFMQSMAANFWNSFLYGSLYRMETDPTRYRAPKKGADSPALEVFKKIMGGAFFKNSDSGTRAEAYETKEAAKDAQAHATVQGGQAIREAMKKKEKTGKLTLDKKTFKDLGVSRDFIRGEVKKYKMEEKYQNSDEETKKKITAKQILQNVPKSQKKKVYQEFKDKGLIGGKK